MQFLLITELGDALLIKSGENTLQTLQTLVGGLIECVTPTPCGALGFQCDVWVNEEGFYMGYGINLVASYMTGRQLVGPAVLTHSTPSGRTTGLTRKNLDSLIKDGLTIDAGQNGNGYTVEEVMDILSEAV